MTREALINVAEVLMASKGIDAVDLHEVQVLAGARNRSAVQYHFKNREGLVVAVLTPAPEARERTTVADARPDRAHR